MTWAIRNVDWNINLLYSQKSLINLSPDYQRRLVWNRETQQYLIWCILRGQDIPKFYFHLRNDELPPRWDVVDGQQRIDTVFKYVENKLKLSQKAKAIAGHNVAGLKFCDLPRELQNVFLSYPCVIAEIETDEYGRVIDQFLALQFGKSLNNQERRQASPGFIRDLVAELCQHPMVQLARISKQRSAEAETLSRLVIWEQHQQIVEARAHNLDRLYLTHVHDSPNHPEWRRVKTDMVRTLNFMLEVFPQRHRELSNISTFTLMYWLMRHLNTSYVIRDEIIDCIRAWFAEFCLHLRQIQYQEGHHSLRHWSGGTNKRLSNQMRFDYMLHHFFERVTDIQPKDEQRLFTDEQRYTIWNRAGGRCEWEGKHGQACNFELSADAWEADHIIPHSQGGATTVENGRVLCPYRNRSQQKAGECPVAQQG